VFPEGSERDPSLVAIYGEAGGSREARARRNLWVVGGGDPKLATGPRDAVELAFAGNPLEGLAGAFDTILALDSLDRQQACDLEIFPRRDAQIPSVSKADCLSD
jgi:hypothetical protein